MTNFTVRALYLPDDFKDLEAVTVSSTTPEVYFKVCGSKSDPQHHWRVEVFRDDLSARELMRSLGVSSEPDAKDLVLIVGPKTLKLKACADDGFTDDVVKGLSSKISEANTVVVVLTSALNMDHVYDDCRSNIKKSLKRVTGRKFMVYRNEQVEGKPAVDKDVDHYKKRVKNFLNHTYPCIP